MIRKSIVIILAATVLLSACDFFGDNGKTAGTTSVTPADSTPSSQPGNVAGKSAATLSGVLLASQPGPMGDDNDLKQASAAETKAYMAPIGQKVTWNSAQNGDGGTITPTKDGYNQSGAYCREFQETFIVGGQQKLGHGTTCQQPDGTWKIVSQ